MLYCLLETPHAKSKLRAGSLCPVAGCVPKGTATVDVHRSPTGELGRKVGPGGKPGSAASQSIPVLFSYKKEEDGVYLEVQHRV